MAVKCSRCRNDNPDGARFCNICGAAIERPQAGPPESFFTVRCVNCGAMNSSALSRCGSCGTDLAPSVKAHESRAQAPSAPSPRQCRSCGREIGRDARVCQYCGEDLETEPSLKVVPASPYPSYAAVLMFGAGVLGIFIAVYNFLFEELPVELKEFEGIKECCSELTALLAVVCILGGYFALKRQRFMLAIVGAIAGMMTVGLYVGFIMSLVALILLAISQKEFKN